MRMSIRRKTRKRSTRTKHNRKSRIFKKNRNNKGYVGGGGGCSKMATVVPIGLGHDVWWRQTNIPTGTGYRWEKYNVEDTIWLNNKNIDYSLDTGISSRHPSYHPIPNREFVLKEGTDFMFDFKNLLQIRMTDGAANKIMFTEGITSPSPNDSRLDGVPPHVGIEGIREPDGIYVTHPWNKIIGSALQFAKSRGVARILSDDDIKEFIKTTDQFPPIGCDRQILPPCQLPGGVFAMDPSSIYMSGNPPPPSTTPGQRRPRRVKPDEGPPVASLASPLASPLAFPPSYQNVMGNLAKYPIYDLLKHQSK